MGLNMRKESFLLNLIYILKKNMKNCLNICFQSEARECRSEVKRKVGNEAFLDLASDKHAIAQLNDVAL